jgi:uncharacterized protein (TIGR02145 family)/fibro-slime domain-containing protein
MRKIKFAIAMLLSLTAFGWGQALTGTATISGYVDNPRIDNVLTAMFYGDEPIGTLIYEWKAGDNSVGSNSGTYTVTLADLDKQITVTITSDVETGEIISDPTTVVLKKVGPAAPLAPHVLSRTHNSITLLSTFSYEYKINDEEWQTSHIFTDLTPETEYTFYQRIAEGEDISASPLSTGLTIATLALCGEVSYNPLTQRCENELVETSCGDDWYDNGTHFCFNNEVYKRCGSSSYDPSTQFCHTDNKLYNKCGDSLYEPSTEYCSNGTVKKYGFVTDSRDGRTYKTIEIGAQIWTAENSNYNAIGSACYDSYSCALYGRLYNWEAAMEACPEGWHLPYNDEWNELITAVGGSSNAFRSLASWSSPIQTGANTYGFAALPGGHGMSFSGSSYSFLFLGQSGYWWSASEGLTNSIVLDQWQGLQQQNIPKNYLHSVRCLSGELPFFIPVTNISMPASVIIDSKVKGSVMPSFATNREIEWNISGAKWDPDTKEIIFDQLGTAVIKATIKGGKCADIEDSDCDYTQNWNVRVGTKCGGKTIAVQLPKNWPQTQVSFFWRSMGQFTNMSGIRNGDFFEFTIPTTIMNDDGTGTFLLSMNSNYGSNRHITTNNYDMTANFVDPRDLDAFSCPIDKLYIYEDPTTPGKTVTSTVPPNIYTFYFLPPKELEWALGTPIFVYNDGGTIKKEIMSLDADRRCGWYKKIFFNEPIPNAASWIWLNGHKGVQPPNDQIGLLGLDEDPMNWVDGAPTPFNLAEQFGTDRDLFFVPATGANGWTKLDPGTSGVCSFNLAAIMYHRGMTGRGFSQWTQSGSGGGVAEGLCRGLVKPELVNGKMAFNERKICGGEQTDWNEIYFNEAFKSTPGVNVQRCYDIPFQKRPGGLWEFDATTLCEGPPEAGIRYGSIDYSRRCGGIHGRYLGGFYPPNLGYAVDKYGDYSAAYTALGRNPNAAAFPAQTTDPETAGGWGNSGVLPAAANEWCFERGWRGGNGTIGDLDGAVTAADVHARMTNAGCTHRFADGEFLSYDGAAGVPNFRDICEMTGACGSGRWHSYPNWSQPRLFCFESAPVAFTYEPGQELFISGSEIWVFINNRLVIDLGGNHVAVPGYVRLDTITTPSKLVPGEQYPLNIFFCNRRANGSDLRIATNIGIYFAEESALRVQHIQADSAQICIVSSGSNSSCASVMASSKGPITKCGSEMGPLLDYYMLNQRGDTLWIDPTKAAEGTCTTKDGSLTCYGGITLTGNYPIVETVIVRRDALFELQGTYRVYAKIRDSEAENYPNLVPVLITRFDIDESTVVHTPSTIPHTLYPIPHTPVFYNLRGQPIGTTKPTAPGVYIEKTGKYIRKIMVK